MSNAGFEITAGLLLTLLPKVPYFPRFTPSTTPHGIARDCFAIRGRLAGADAAAVTITTRVRRDGRPERVVVAAEQHDQEPSTS